MRLRHRAMTLSNLPAHPFRAPALEQYGTDGETAARWLYSINSEEPFEHSNGIIDLGAGNGILGIGALLLGAPNAIFVEIDEEVCKSLQEAIESLELGKKCRILNGDVRSINHDEIRRDIVVMNPPWGDKHLVQIAHFWIQQSNVPANPFTCYTVEVLNISNHGQNPQVGSQKGGWKQIFLCPQYTLTTLGKEVRQMLQCGG